MSTFDTTISESRHEYNQDFLLGLAFLIVSGYARDFILRVESYCVMPSSLVITEVTTFLTQVFCMSCSDIF
jgi:hypothetical protein